MAGLIAELRRRNVFRVAVAYLALSWVLLQVGDVVFEALGLGNSANALLLAILAIGLIPALVFSWVFEWTPEGVVVDSGRDSSDRSPRTPERRLDIAVIVLLLTGIGLLTLDRLLPRATETTVAAVPADANTGSEVIVEDADRPGRSIAVLPFVNMSAQSDDEYFADGVSEEIINVLVQVPKLQVVGRTSSFAFKGRNMDLREIGSALGVGYLLEGSVRRSGEDLRVTAQLIRSDTGFHLWSEAYDAQLIDIFDIQEDIARSVASELALSLGLDQRRLVLDRTDDLVAYEKYLRAKQLYLQRGRQNLGSALVLLQEVVARDPDFAPAWAAMAAVYSVFESWQPNQPPSGDYLQWREIGMAAARRAIRLHPSNAEAHVSLGWFLFFGKDFVAAFEEMDRAIALAPDSSSVLDDVAQAMMQVGYIDEAEALSRRAVASDPLVPIFQKTLGVIYMDGSLNFGDAEPYARAVEQFRRVIELDPTFPDTHDNIYWIRMRQSDFDGAAAAILDGIAAGAFTERQADHFESLVAAAREGKNALLEESEGMDEWLVRLNVSEVLGDLEHSLAVAALDWESDYLREPFYFSFSNPEIYRHEQWQAQIRDSGVLALWRSRGFPPQCRPVGPDDFECYAEVDGLPVR